MNVLIACEESQRVCEQFRIKGHNAFSCDILNCSGGHPEWHIKGDVIPLLNGHCEFITMDFKKHLIVGRWDLIIAFPPCTHLAVSGAAWFERKRQDGRQKQALEFFGKIMKSHCNKIAIENPIGIISGDSYIRKWFPEFEGVYEFPIKPTQIIQPWQFGDNVGKSTCLWLKNLDKLEPEITERPAPIYHEWVDKYGRKKRQEQWFYETRCLPHKQRGIVASKTFPGIARAMAETWG